ncbi:MAG: hypothetical protein ACRDHM_08710 [Actinomycetota bacterium]
MTDVRMRRGLLVLAAAFLCLAVAGPAVGKPKPTGEEGKPVQKKIEFLPGTDISAWYWNRQVDEEVTTPVTLPPPIPPASQRVRLPNPQRPDTIPVALNQGQPERMSAVKFELLERGVTDGSKINKLILYVEESIDRNEQPSISPETAKIQACQILDFLPQGEEEKFADAPKFSDTDCAQGTREAIAGAPAPVWTFDLTKIAEAWGKNAFDNNGVMLAPVVEAGKTWQVNLKVPRKETPAEEGDQYELTKNRNFLTIDYIPGEPLEIPEVEVPEDTTTTTPTSAGGSVGSIPSSLGTTSTSPLISPSTDLTGGSSEIPGAEAAPAPAPTEVAGFGLPQEQGPRMPAYVWLAIPLGLLALAAVRSVILEPVGGPRPDGVIAAIRRRNAERRGGALGQRTGFLGGMTAGFRRGTGSIGKALSGATKIVRRKR